MTHKEVISSLLDKKVAILAGAGISYNSGLPVVSAFYKHFLPLFYETEDVDYLTSLIYNGHIPFERMMEHIFNYTGNDYSIMNIFANGEPNTLHNILAQMMSNGWAAELYTTNFDCLIEKALENKGIMKEDYGYFYDEKGFAKLSKATCSKNVIKIHGTIDNEKSIRTTLETITSNERLNKRKPPVERLFSTGKHEIVIVLGYSFSDIFDVNEFIKKLNINKTIVVIDHNRQTEDSNVQPLANKKGNNPFLGKNCNGYVVNMDTLAFMSELCLAKYGNIPTANPQKYEWRNYLDNWASKFDSVHKAYIAGGICTAMNEFKIADKYITQAFQTVNPNKIDLYISIINQYTLTKFRVRKDQKECDNLVSLCKKAIEILENNKYNLSEDFYIKRLDDLTYRLGRIYEDGYFDYETAKKYYFSSYRIEYRINDTLEMSRTLHQIGLVYSSLNNITSTIKCFKKSIRLKKKCGYIGGITRTYYTMAAEIFRNDRKKLKQAEYYLRKATDSVQNVGETELIYYINNLQGTIYIERGAWNEAESLLKKNISNLETQSHTSILSTAYYNLARCEMRLKKYDNAIERLEKNLKIVNDLGDKQRVFRNNQELAFAYLLSEDIEKCFQYLSKNIDVLSSATNAEKGHFFFYVALYYKKHNLKTYYKQFLDVSKSYFQVNEIIKDFHSLKRDFDREIISDKTIILDKDKYILREIIEECEK